MQDAFARFAAAAARYMGTPVAFIAAVALIGGWALSYPLFKSLDSYQLLINSITTVITFLMVFLIQSTQNRDSRALHLKLDELIRTSHARDSFADLEDASEEELARLQEEFRRMRKAK
jgi:low affinity Fe/Cu permease